MKEFAKVYFEEKQELLSEMKILKMQVTDVDEVAEKF
jgi:hypothetical protein